MSAFAETLEPFLVIDTMGDTLTSYKLLQCLSHKSIQPLRFSLPWSDKACLNEIFRHLHLCILKTASLQASKRRFFLLQRTWAAVKRKPVHRLSFFQTNTDVKHVTSSTQLRKPLCRYATNPDINFDQLWFPPCTFQPWWDTPFPKAVPQKIDVESFFLLGVRISKKKTSQSATVGYALLAVNASEVVVSVIWKQVAPYLPYLGIRSNSMFSSRKTLSGYEGTTDKGAMQPQSTELTQWNLIPLTSHNYVFSSRSSSCTRKALFLFVMFFFAPQKVGVLQPLWGFMSFLCGVGPRRAIWKSQQQNDWWIAKLWTKTIF